MALKCGIVGLPNIGKSTLFNALAKGNATAANFPFCTIEPNIGVVTVPDERIEVLAGLANSQKIIPTCIEFVDIAGLVKGASQGEGLGNQFLATIREVDAIVHVIRCFNDDNIVHVAGGVDPLFDQEVIDHELRQKDLETLDKWIAKGTKTLKSGTKLEQQEWQLLQHFFERLSQGDDARSIILDGTALPIVAAWQLLTNKPIIYVANVDEETLQVGGNSYVNQLKEKVKNEEVVLVCAPIEAQLNELTLEEDKKIFLEAYQLTTSSLDKLIQASYRLLNLITYFTVGPQEVRAWTVPKGTRAPQAAGVIHSDFERGFIKAEIIKLVDYQKYKTEAACKEAGKLHIEGKSYVIQDGDIACFRFNVSK